MVAIHPYFPQTNDSSVSSEPHRGNRVTHINNSNPETISAPHWSENAIKNACITDRAYRCDTNIPSKQGDRSHRHLFNCGKPSGSITSLNYLPSERHVFETGLKYELTVGWVLAPIGRVNWPRPASSLSPSTSATLHASMTSSVTRLRNRPAAEKLL